MDRDLNEKNKYPLYYLGLFFAVSFTVCNALKFLAMSELGNMVHSSVKTFWFGVFSTVVTIIYLMFEDPQLFLFWNMGQPQYSINSDQFFGAFIIGFFSWAGQESLSLALTKVKNGSTAAFISIGLVIAFFTDVLYFERQ